MRLGIDASPLGSGRGGDETLMRGLIAGLQATAEDDDRLVLIGARSPVPPDPRVAAISTPARPGVVRYAHTLPRVLRHCGDQLDAVLSITHAPLRSPIPTALLVTDLSFVHHPEFYPRTVRARLRAVIGRQVRQAAVVLTISEFCRAQIVDEYQLPADRVRVVPCVVEPGAIPSRAALDAVRSQLQARIGAPYFLSLGNLHARKNTVRTIEAFAAARRSGDLSDHRLVIAGARWWRDAPEFAVARQLEPGAVEFLGVVTDTERRVLLEAATALVYPSLFEGFGLPPLEAMAAGTPAIVSDRAALPETCGDAALFVDPTDVDDIARGLTLIAADDELRARLRAAGIARAASYSRERSGRAAWAALRTVDVRARR